MIWYKNCINNFCYCCWFVSLCCQCSSSVSLKTKILFPKVVILWYVILTVSVLEHCSESDPNCTCPETLFLATGFLTRWLSFVGVEKYCESSSRFISLCNLLVFCRHAKGLVSIWFSGEVCFLPVLPWNLELSEINGTKNIVLGDG